MIKLTRLDGKEILLNEDYIEIIEMAPDTVITLQNGHRLFVEQTVDEILERVRDFQRIKFMK